MARHGKTCWQAVLGCGSVLIAPGLVAPAIAEAAADEQDEPITLVEVSAEWSGAILAYPGPAARFATPAAASGPRGASYAAELLLAVEAVGITDDGIEYGVLVEGRAGVNDPPTIVQSGPAPCPPASACPSGTSARQWRLEAGEDVTLAHDRAYAFLRGGWGEVGFGHDDGVGEKLGIAAPDLLEHARMRFADVDPQRLSGVRVANNVSDIASKLNVTTPRIVGVMLGASFTPEVEMITDHVAVPGRDVLRDVAEFAASFSHKFVSLADRRAGEGGLRVEASYSVIGGQIELGDYVSHGIGAGVAADDWSLGAAARWGEADQAGAMGSADHIAWEIGATRTLGDWTLGALYGAAGDDAMALDARSWRVTAARGLMDGVTLVAGWSVDRVRGPWATEGTAIDQTVAETTRSRSGLLFELRFSAPLTRN